jgi:hypothetical protein
MTERIFSADDVRKVATALLETAIDWDDGHGNNECRHCMRREPWRSDGSKIDHKLDCPVLVARDLLT